MKVQVLYRAPLEVIMGEIRIPLKNIPGVREKVQSLIERLQSLRISDSDYFGISYETECAYDKANDMLDECLQVVYDFCKENNLI